MDKSTLGLARANRLLRLTGLVNRAIARRPSADDLLRQVCHVAVECGEFRLAWAGRVDGGSDAIRIAARCGDATLPEDRLVAGGGLADQARRAGAARIVNDLEAGPRMPERDDLLRRGVRAVAALPLREEGSTSGVIMLYADDAGRFDEAAAGLLHDMVDDIAQGLHQAHEDERRHATESRLRRLAFHDHRTGLPNQALLDEQLPLLARGGSLALFDIRLQRMAPAVQIYGRLSTDEVLRAVAARLENQRSSTGFLAHLAPDEFVLAVPGMKDIGDMESCAQRLLRALREPVGIDREEVFLQPSVGCAAYPVHESDCGQLLRRARIAAARDTAHSGARIYSPRLDQLLEPRLRMEADLHRALEREEFALCYQPQLSLRSGKIVGVEALLQWRHPERGLVAPGEFVPVLEDCGLMPAVGAWVLRSACLQAGAWRRQGIPPLRVGVNVSALQFRLGDLLKLVTDALEESGMEPVLLELELTESLILENVDRTVAAMHQLKSLGVALSLDDFGTGYSSLAYLRRYPVDRIKIDRSFIVDMTAHADSAALVRSILAMAGNLGLRTIAEGVETFEQFNYLRKVGCDEMQGFLFSQSVSAEEIAHMAVHGSGLAAVPGGGPARPTLLLVDSDAGLPKRMRSLLANERWAVLSASTGDEALRLLAAHDADVVVTAAELPDRNGGELLGRVRGMYPEAVCILLCERADFHALADAVNRADGFRVLSGPVDPAVLAHTIDEAYFVSKRGEGGRTRSAGTRRAATGS